MEYDRKDVRLDMYSYGNMAYDRRVKATHLPTGLEVLVDDEPTIFRAQRKALEQIEAAVRAA